MGITLLIWALQGYESGPWGYPVGGHEVDANGVDKQRFERMDFNVLEYFMNGGTTEYAGEETLQIIADVLDNYGVSKGVDIEGVIQGLNSTENTQAQSRAALAAGMTIERVDNGGLFVPAGYNNPLVRTTTPQSSPGLHDYCTLSPEFIPILTGYTRAVAVDLRAPCAMHDMCYERTPASNSHERMVCDNKLRQNIQTVCKGVFPGATQFFRRQDCNQISWAYFWGVAVAHPGHYF